jgi:large subunit ribosomal protein L4
VKLEVYTIKGKASGEEVELPKKVFGIEPNDHAIWQAVTAERANTRQGTSATKNRSAARGGGRKPWRQKGRGTARAGTIRSPLWVGGGRTFGPSPRSYTKRLPAKVLKLARKSALAHKAKEERIRLVEDFSLESPKTKAMHEILAKLKLNENKVLLLTSDSSHSLYLSGRNIPYFEVREAVSFSTQDVVRADTLVIQKGALERLNEVLGK